MMTKQNTAAAVLKTVARNLHKIADNTADWLDAEAIRINAARVIEQADALELEAQDSTEDHPALDRAA